MVPVRGQDEREQTAASNLKVPRTIEGSPDSPASFAGCPSYCHFLQSKRSFYFCCEEPDAFQFLGIPWREARISFFYSGSLGTDRRAESQVQQHWAQNSLRLWTGWQGLCTGFHVTLQVGPDKVRHHLCGSTVHSTVYPLEI